VRLDEAITDLASRLAPLSETAGLEAQLLLAYILHKSRAWVLSHPEVVLTPAQQSELERSAACRLSGEPLPYILGHWEFFGLDFQVTPAVLIPRPETELLVEHALDWLRRHPTCRQAADVGTGSGCIAIALASRIPDLRILATDISPQVLEIARRNAAQHGVSERITFVQADLLKLPGEYHTVPFDLVAANLPYIPRQALAELPVSRFEPTLALDGGDDGLDLIRRLLQQAPGTLSPQGCLLLEIEARQGESASALAKAAFPQAQIQLLPDLGEYNRLVEVVLSASNSQQYLVHLCSRSAWLAAQQLGDYKAESLASEGFIHLSRPDQILKVANAFYRDLPETILLWIDPLRLQAELRWEPTEADVFPHLYGELNLDAVIAVRDLLPDPDGFFRGDIPTL
jgi:release factor glutamine methyltransferase